MRMLIVIRSWGFGGEQRAVSTLAQSFVESGHRVSVLALAPVRHRYGVVIDQQIRLYGIEITRGGPVALVRGLRELRREIVTGSYDVLVGFGTAAAIYTLCATGGIPTPVVVCERTDPARFSISWRMVRDAAYRLASGAVFQTEGASRYFSDKYFNTRVVIPNAVHPDSTAERSVTKRRDIVCSVSSLTKNKNVSMLIRAFARVASRFSEYELEVFGDGPMRPELEELIATTAASDRIRLVRPIPDVIAEISDRQIFVLCSDREGFPNALAEAMCLGLACVATDSPSGGPRSMISDGKNGLLIPVGDEEALVRALETLMSDYQYAREMGESAKMLKEGLEARRIGHRWLSFIEEVIANVSR